MQAVLLRDAGAAMRHIDNSLLNHAYECLFDMELDGIWKHDVLTVLQRDKKRAEIFDWLVGVIDAANAPFIQRSAAPMEKEMRKLFQENPFLRALYECLATTSRFRVEFDVEELANQFRQDADLFRDLSDWIANSVLPRIELDPRYWERAQALNQISIINRWSYDDRYALKDLDARARMIKKADFIVRWLQLLLEAGIHPDRISKKTFERWRQKKQGSTGTHQ